MIQRDWLDKPYYSLDAYCKKTFHTKVYKIALNAHLSCPNRDGSLDTRGCIFCSAGGSGDFAVDVDGDLDSQIQKGLSMFGAKQVGSKYIGYFQAYTNTYAPVSYLKEIFQQALAHPALCGISIATRPDCLPPEVLELLENLKNTYPEKSIWVELGLQTMHEATASYIRRGYSLDIFEKAMHNLQSIQIPVIVHVILGLPGETEKMQLETIDYLNTFHPFGIKLQLLHILKGTDLAVDYESSHFHVFSKEEYVDVLIQCIEHLSPDIVIHRVTGDGPKDLLLAPTWSSNKKDVLNTLHHQFKIRNSYQGKQYLKY